MDWERLLGPGKQSSQTRELTDVFRTLAELSSWALPAPLQMEPRDYSRPDRTPNLSKFYKLQTIRNSIVNLGWLWVSGTTIEHGEPQLVCFPAVYDRVSYDQNSGAALSGDLRISSHVTDTFQRLVLLRRVHEELDFASHSQLWGIKRIEEWGSIERVETWARDFVAAAGLEFTGIESGPPQPHLSDHGVRVHLGVALYESGTATTSKGIIDLGALRTIPNVHGTAFDELYGADKKRSRSVDSTVMSFRPLSFRQKQIAAHLSGASLAVLTGAPGTGKTHLISAAAADAIARGESVLVVAGSPRAVDVLVEHFALTPGLPPIAFGGSRYGRQIHDELLELREMISDDDEVDDELRSRASDHDRRVMAVRRSIGSLYGKANSNPETATFDRALDDVVVHELEAAEVGGKFLVERWINRLNRREKKALDKIAAAIVVNRYERRRVLSAIKPKALVEAAPLWVGSLEDTNDVLPNSVGMFDLVIFDEASQIDQVAAATALVRAKRALVVGDPQQIGFEPYLSDDEIVSAQEMHNTLGVELDLDTRSLFDAAAARVPVQVLDEHFRSGPHLIEFSSRRFYDGGLYTATRHPSNEAADHIDVSVVASTCDKEGKNETEVAEAIRVLDEHIGRAWGRIGLITPFVAQANALETAVEQSLTLERANELNIRVGTFHDFQGDEVDLMIVSFAVGSDEPDSAWRQVNEPRAFNVMATRARQHVHIITSNPKPPGLAGEYVQWAQPLVDLLRDEEITDPWTLEVADTLTSAGIATRTGYRSGRYIVDLVAGEGEHAVAIDCVPHADGVDAHIDRALMLRRTGWRTADCYQQKWQYLLDDYPERLRRKFAEL